MEDIIEEITAYVAIINPDLEDDDFLEFVINSVVDRFLTYTNRDQLVEDYEEDLVNHPIKDDPEFWVGYDYPIPPRMERVLAQVIVGMYKTVQSQVDGATPAISQITDNGQSITYKESMNTYLSSESDAEVFGEASKLMDKFRLLKVVKNGYSSRL